MNKTPVQTIATIRAHENFVSWVLKKMEETKADAVYGDVHYVSHKNLNKCVRY